jgi:hypothetical protein
MSECIARREKENREWKLRTKKQTYEAPVDRSEHGSIVGIEGQ